jgi:uncharacterized damage-inducible protein DinB
MSDLKQLLIVQTGYSAWATRQLLDACSCLTPEHLDSGLGASHSSILRTFRHMYDGERVWLQRLGTMGEWRLPQGPSPKPSFEFLVQSWPELWLGYRRCLESASGAGLTREHTTLLPADTHIHGPHWRIVLHAVNHSTLHRGQIITMLRSFGVSCPNTDLTSYYLAL